MLTVHPAAATWDLGRTAVRLYERLGFRPFYRRLLAPIDEDAAAD